MALGYDPLKVSDPMAWVRREIALVGSYGFTRAEITELLGWIVQGRISLDCSLSHRIRRDEAPHVLADMAA